MRVFKILVGKLDSSYENKGTLELCTETGMAYIHYTCEYQDRSPDTVGDGTRKLNVTQCVALSKFKWRKAPKHPLASKGYYTHSWVDKLGASNSSAMWLRITEEITLDDTF